MNDVHDSSHLHAEASFDALIAAARTEPPLRTACVHPVSPDALRGCVEARELGLIDPVLVAPAAKLAACAAEIGLSLEGWAIEDVPHSHAAARRAVDLARQRRVHALMKGSLHTDELMIEVVSATAGLRTERRVSHVFVQAVPTYPKLLLITDAAINILPTLEEKRDIAQNAIELAQALGVARPKVAVLAAVETVTSKLKSTLDAAALCKMADRGQIRGGIIDGPLAFDNAISRAAATAKGIVSEVAGDLDVLLVPDLESGNMLAKQLEHLANAESAGIVLGAQVPVMLTSRSDPPRSRVVSCAIAQLFARARRKPASGTTIAAAVTIGAAG